jgi:hypothetical protein
MNRTFRSLVIFLVLLAAIAVRGRESGDAQLQGALDAFVAGDYPRAHQLLGPLAEAGRSEAQLLLGVLYERGYAVDRDPVAAYSWYLRAARLHNPKAEESLARLGARLDAATIQAAESMAQDNRLVLDKDYGCISFFGEEFASHYVTTFQAHQSIESMVGDVLGHTGLKKNFTVQAANVPNAAAVIQGSTRYLLYNPYFINEVNDKSGTAWAAYSVMAHEVGHHLEGHTIQPGGSRPSIELEADRFSGFILAKMGAGLTDAQAAMANLADPYRSATHPARNERLSAIEEGWRDAMGKEPPAPGPTPPPAPVMGRIPSTAPLPSSPYLVARSCATSYGSCPMMVPISVGSVCYCVSPYGSIPGYGR